MESMQKPLFEKKRQITRILHNRYIGVLYVYIINAYFDYFT